MPKIHFLIPSDSNTHRNECTSNTSSGYLDCIMLFGSSLYYQFHNIRHLRMNWWHVDWELEVEN